MPRSKLANLKKGIHYQVRDIGPVVELRLIGDADHTKFQEFGTIHIPAKFFMTKAFMQHAPRVGELSKRGGR